MEGEKIQDNENIDSQSLPNQSDLKTNKKPFICRFYMKGECNKEDKCEFIHQQKGISFKNHLQQFNCRYFSQGLCNSSCKFKHEVSSEDQCPETIPIWFIEFYLNKKIERIFEEAEIDFLKDETIEIRKRILNNELPVFARTTPVIPKATVKQDSLVKYIESNNVEYFIISQEDYIVNIYKTYSIVFINEIRIIKEAFEQNKKVILLLFNSTYKFFLGFLEVVSNKEFTKDNLKEFGLDISFPSSFKYFVQMTWLWEWRTLTQRINFLKNSLFDNKPLQENNDLAKVDNIIGVNVCKFMMKKLEKNETINLFKNYMDTNAFTSSSNLLSVESLENINSISKEAYDININEKKGNNSTTKKEETDRKESYNNSNSYKKRNRSRSRNRSYSKDKYYKDRDRDDKRYRDDKYYRNDKYYKDDKYYRERDRDENGYYKEKFLYSDSKYTSSKANGSNRSDRKYH